MHQIGSLICNKRDKLMVKMTILFLLCTAVHAYIDVIRKRSFRASVECDGWVSKGKDMIEESVRWAKKGRNMNKQYIVFIGYQNAFHAQ